MLINKAVSSCVNISYQNFEMNLRSRSKMITHDIFQLIVCNRFITRLT